MRHTDSQYGAVQ